MDNLAGYVSVIVEILTKLLLTILNKVVFKVVVV